MDDARCVAVDQVEQQLWKPLEGDVMEIRIGDSYILLQSNTNGYNPLHLHHLCRPPLTSSCFS